MTVQLRPRPRRFARKRMLAVAGLAGAALTMGGLTACEETEATGADETAQEEGGNTDDAPAENTGGETDDETDDEAAAATIPGSAGELAVGVDVQPGLYKTSGNGDLDFCVWSRLDEAGEELASDIVQGVAYVEIFEGDAMFTTSECKDWEAVPDNPTGEQLTEIGGNGGDYLVGVDIVPGTYKTEGNAEDSDCAYERNDGGPDAIDSLLEIDFVTGQAIVTIEETDAYFSTNYCNDWVKQD